MLCVVVCGDRRGLAYWNVLIMFLLGVVHLIFTKPSSKKEKDCLVKGWGPTLSHVQNKTILGVILFGLGMGSREFHKTK